MVERLFFSRKQLDALHNEISKLCPLQTSAVYFVLLHVEGLAMDSNKLNNWLQVGAMFAVLVGLILLVVELRQNQDLMRAQTRHELAVTVMEILHIPAANKQLADVMYRANLGENLTAEELHQFRMRTNALFRYWENVHYQYRQGLYDDSEFDTHRRAWRSLLTGPTVSVGIRTYWCQNQSLGINNRCCCGAQERAAPLNSKAVRPRPKSCTGGENMSEYELSSLVYELFRDMDSQIQFWMQATFAVVVAVFFAGERLPRGIRRVVAALYLVASVLAALRWLLVLRRVLSYRAQMVTAGYQDIPTDWWLVLPVTALIALMFLGGVTATMYFLGRPSAGRAQPQADPSP